MASNFDSYDRSILVGNMGTMFLYTENSGNTSTLYSFSNAGGQSAWSFGLIQADVGHNGQAQSFLQTIGFNQSQIAELSQQGQISASELASLNQILASHEGAVDQFMAVQMDQKINRLDQLINILKDVNPSAAQSILGDKDLQLRLLDFDNQFNISGLGGSSASQNGMLRYLEGYPVTLGSGAVLQLPAGAGLSADDIKNYIGNTTQAIQNPNDIQRRSSDLDKALNEIHSSTNGDSGGDGQSVSDTIDQNGNTVSTVTDGDRTTVSIYDPNGVLLQTTVDYDDGSSHVSNTTTYDGNGAVTSVENIATQTDSANATTTTTTTTTYDPNTGAAVERDVVTDDGRGNINVDHYDGNGVLVSDSWNNSNGASGTDTYRSDGTLASDTWDNGHGQSGTDTYGEDGSSTSVTNSSWETTTVTVTPNPDGSTTTTTVNSFPAAAGYGGDYGGGYGGDYGGGYGGGYGTGEYGAEHGYQVTTTTTTNPDGSSIETTVSNQDGYNDTTTTVTAPDGSYTQNEWNDVGEHSSQSYNATTGEYDTSTYNADGSHTDEQQIGDTYNSTSYDANGNVTRTETDTSTSQTVTTNNSDGSTTVDERAPSSSGSGWDETITTTNSDGSHSETRITNDGGERVTDNYDDGGHLTSESGYNDAAPSDHTSSGTIDSHWETTYNADGSSATHEVEVAGNGQITHDTTTDSYGDTVSATTTIEVNGVSDQTTQNSDGSHSTAHWDDNGNYDSHQYDADGHDIHDVSRSSDGSYSDQTYDPTTGSTTEDAYNGPTGEHSTYESTYDADGIHHEVTTFDRADGSSETLQTDTINGISLTTDTSSDGTTDYYMNGGGITADQFDQYWQDYFAGDGASNDPGAGDPGTGDPGAGDGSSSTPDMAAGTTDQQAAA